jgi:DNA repair protein RAD16
VNNVHVTVFLVSLKAGGVALNLTEASRVYLMDSWWNPAVSFLSPPSLPTFIVSDIILAWQVEFRESMCIVISYFSTQQRVEAMDRIHRLGQRRPVQAIKLVIEDSIESRIVQLQEKKSAMVDATLSTDDSVRVKRVPYAILLTATSP